ncbi:MAG: hypothetical protein ACLR1G_05210 [Alistipes indistinctus]
MAKYFNASAFARKNPPFEIGEEKRFRRITVHLDKQQQDHTEFRYGPVDPQRVHRLSPGHQVFDHLPVDELVGHTGHTAHE